MPSRSCLFLLFLFTAMLVVSVSAGPPPGVDADRGFVDVDGHLPA